MALCSGRHITEMQLFHELKQRFPSIPDRLVTHCIKQTRGNRAACACILEAETILSSYKMSGRPSSLQLESDPFSEEVAASHSAPATPSINRKLSVDRISCSTPSSPVIDIGKPLRPPVVRSAIMPDVKPISLQTQKLISEQLTKKKKVEDALVEIKEIVKHRRKIEEELRMKLEQLSVRSPEHLTLIKEVSMLRDRVNSLNDEAAAKFASGINCRISQDLGDLGESYRWYCSSCTSRNHPQLYNCEACNMPRIVVDVGDSQNIHIHVTHHNFPSCSLRPCCSRCYLEYFDEIDYGGW